MQHGLAAIAAAMVAAWGPAPEELASSPASEVDVRWTGTAACVDEPTLHKTIEQLIPAGASGVLELSAARQADGWRVGVGFADVQRELVHADCALLTEAVALIVAVRTDAVSSAGAVQPAAPLQRPTPIPMPASAAAPEPEASEPKPKRRSLARSRPESTRPRPPLGLRWQGGLRAGIDVGTLPRGGGSLAAEVGLRWRSVAAEWGATATLAPPFRPEDPGIEVRFAVFSTALRGCYVFEGHNVDVPLCTGVELGAVRARPSELSSPNDVDALWFAPVAGIRLQRWFGRAAPLVFFDVAVPVLRHSFEVEATSVHTLPPLVVRAGVGLRFGGR